MNRFPKDPEYNGGKFVAGVDDTGGAPWLANISANFWITWNGPNGSLWGIGKMIHEKNQKQKISTLSL
jgi:hypothetical protein